MGTAEALPITVLQPASAYGFQACHVAALYPEPATDSGQPAEYS
jgi:hypothetical protein